MSPQPQRQIDNRPPRPTTLGEAKAVIVEAYRLNDWNEIEQQYYERSLGLEDVPLPDRSRDDVEVILNDLEKSRMVIFRD